MAKTLQLRRYDTSTLNSVTGASGELIIDNTLNTVTVHDGSTVGGVRLAKVTDIPSLTGYATQTYVNQGLSSKQDTLISGTNIRSINGTSLLGSGNINIKTINGTSLIGSGDVTIDLSFAQISEDVLPMFDSVYDIGSSEKRWYTGYFDTLDINGAQLTGTSETISTTANFVSSSLVSDTALIGQVLISDNLITPENGTQSEYLGDKGTLIINGNLDVQGDWVNLPVVETVEETTTVMTPTTEEVEVVTETPIDYVGGYSNGSGNYPPQAFSYSNTWVNGTRIQFTWPEPQQLRDYLFSLSAGDTIDVTILDSNNNYAQTRRTYTLSSGFTGGATFFASIDGVQGSEDPIRELHATTTTTTIETITTETPTTITTSIPPSTTGSEGLIRFNKDTVKFEGHDGTEWGSLGGVSADDNGNATIDANLIVTGDVISLSDEREKENITKVESALSIVNAINGVYYNLKSDTEKRHVGVIAQNVEQVLPEVVYDSNGTKSVAYGNIVGVLIEAIKEQQIQIEELKVKLNGI